MRRREASMEEQLLELKGRKKEGETPRIPKYLVDRGSDCAMVALFLPTQRRPLFGASMLLLSFPIPIGSVCDDLPPLDQTDALSRLHTSLPSLFPNHASPTRRLRLCAEAVMNMNGRRTARPLMHRATRLSSARFKIGRTPASPKNKTHRASQGASPKHFWAKPIF
jgi:hypothetical protein